MHEGGCKRCEMAEPHCVFFESSRGEEALDCGVVVFGAEVALSAVFVYDVEEADGHCDAGYAGAETPVVFYAVGLVVGEGHEVHVALVRISRVSGGRGVVGLTPIELHTLHMQLQFYLILE